MTGRESPREFRPSLFDLVQGAEVISPDDHSITRFAPYVSITPEAREAALELAEAAWEWVEEMTAEGVADDTRLVRATTRFFA